MKTDLISLALVSLSSCVAAGHGADLRASSATAARGEEVCLTFPSLSLPDPPPEYPKRVCWREPAPAGHSLGQCPRSMARVAGGTLAVFAPEFARRTQAIDAFCMERGEVTVSEFRACVEAGACAGRTDSAYAVRISESDRARHTRLCNARAADRGAHPVNCVSWPQAVAYCAWRYGPHGALPTEDQWAWAARGSTKNRYPWGDAPPDREHVNRCGLSCMHLLERLPPSMTADGELDGWVSTAPAGQFRLGESGFSIHDLAGNVAEWTRSRYGQYRRSSAGVMEFQADDAALRVVRGGSWLHTDDSAFEIDERAWLLLTDRASWVGFRCVLEAQ